MTLTPQKALNKAYRRQSVNKEDLEVFKSQLLILLDSVNDEHEEHHKNDLIRFLDDTFYKGRYYINTKERIDCVINSGANKSDPVNVIIEHKSPSNKSEMISVQDINKKALQESILYYMRERFDSDGKDSNTNLKQILITNNVDVFIFDAVLIENLFAKNKSFKKDFIEFESDQKSGQDTKFFYESIAKPFIESIKEKIEYTYVNLENYRKYLNTNSNDSKLLNLFKLFSPTHLLKLNFTNDSNSLDKNFYNELLHIIGLEEVKDGGKKLIQRCKSPNYGSILENAIDQVKTEVRLSDVANLNSFGEERDEQIYNISLELVITWINRILFLKLLESQLISYNSSDDYKFVDKKNIHDYDSLYLLFFKVLAIKTKDRRPDIAEKYKQVPYLNSSLFDITELERQAIGINTLSNSLKLPLATSTVLKDNKGKRLTGEKETLTYLLEFLEAYNFSSEGTAQVQEDNKTLINASVLGLIYEKLNGYKDGSFFTPGYITMYMSHETIRRAVVQKFNDSIDDVTFDSFDDLKAYTRRYFKSDDISNFNTIVNSIRICDPAVGSGHFLVSALNELIAIKHELGILADKDYKPLPIDLEIENDELMITDRFDELFAYNPKSKDSQNIQETLFHEKQTLIENCLFGVDINPNSVKICRLRLWIELLKNTYYKDGGELEVLPNIDINIKCGNSLISRFAMDVNLKKALKNSKWNINSYRNAVATYRNAKTKEEKREMTQLIDDIKNDFRTEIHHNSPEFKKLRKLEKEQYEKFIAPQMFADELTPKQKKKLEEEHKKLNKKITAANQEIEEIKNNKIYTNAFEWRFEFPEVLDNNGDFRGFDVVVGNPPYIDSETMVLNIPNERIYYSNHFKVASGNWDIFLLFIELGKNIIKDDAKISYILPNKLISAGYAKKTRELILNMNLYKLMDFSEVNVFQEASVYPIIIFIEKNTKQEPIKIKVFDTNLNVTKKVIDKSLLKLNNEWNILVVKSENVEILNKVFKKNEMNINENIRNTATVSEAYELKKIISDEDFKNTNVKIINTGTIDPYLSLWGLKKMQYIKDGYEKPVVDKKVFNNTFPNRYEYISKNKICIAGMAKRIEAFLDYGEYFSAKSTTIITDLEVKTLEFLTGLLNSKLINFILYNLTLTQKMSGGYVNINSSTLNKLPIAKPTNEGETEISNFVNQILEAKKQDPEADTQQLEDEIDHLVYKLYDLTYDEVLIVDPETSITKEEYDA